MEELENEALKQQLKGDIASKASKNKKAAGF